MRACVESGLKVPEDVAFTGFDNDSFGAYAYSPLTTVAQPSAKIAEAGVKILTKWISGEEKPPKNGITILPCEIIERKSCGG